ncbi:hypothetical protein TSMEX_007881 [Taenia solium]|eukprot:TsM_000865100 transcript=TsM_000865100 gene=TsM_000865100
MWNDFNDLLILVSARIESVGWVICIAFTKRGYRLIGLSANQTPRQLQRHIDAKVMDGLSKRLGEAHMEFISKPFTLLILRRPVTMRFSPRLVADLCKQQNTECFCNMVRTSNDEEVGQKVHQTLRFASLLDHLLGAPHVLADRLEVRCIAAKWV